MSKLITVEGLDGCGKDTLVYSLQRILARCNIPYRSVSMLEQSQLRDYLLTTHQLCNTQRAMLYKVSAENARREVEAAFEAGEVVLMNRGPATYLAYNGHGEQNVEVIQSLLNMLPKFPYPDLTLYLDVDIVTGLKRVAQRANKDVVESRDLSFFHRVQRSFDEQHAASKDQWYKWCKIDTNHNLPFSVLCTAVAAMALHLENEAWQELARAARQYLTLAAEHRQHLDHFMNL